MKMTQEDFSYLQRRVAEFDTEFNRSQYKAANLSTTRYQWDLVCHAKLMPWICESLYPYLNDSHIQTALNKIIKPL